MAGPGPHTDHTLARTHGRNQFIAPCLVIVNSTVTELETLDIKLVRCVDIRYYIGV